MVADGQGGSPGSSLMPKRVDEAEGSAHSTLDMDGQLHVAQVCRIWVPALYLPFRHLLESQLHTQGWLAHP